MPQQSRGRDDFSAATRKALLMRVAGACSRPGCRRMTLVPDPDYPSNFEVTGRAAHIASAAHGGPRYDAGMSPQQRRAAENGIWLCGDCADLIDKKQGRGFSVELLKSWKAQAEQEVANAALLGSMAQRPAWLSKIASPYYINLPRVLHLSSDALSPEAAKSLKNGFPERGYIYPELQEVKFILRRLAIKTIDVEQLLQPSLQVVEGLAISFYRSCRTRNAAETHIEAVQNYSFEKSPLIYCSAHRFKYVMPYDPAWVTTNTAVATMRSGNTTMAGIALVKEVNRTDMTAICTPLTFGVPDLLGLFG